MNPTPAESIPRDAATTRVPVVIIDTNIWLDLLIFDDARTRRLEALLSAAALTTLASREMRAELVDVVARAQFGLDEGAQAGLLTRYDTIVTPAPVAPDCRLPCSDPDDQKFLDLAIGRRSDWLLSRDRALLRCRKLAWKRFEVRIGQVADFYNWIDES